MASTQAVEVDLRGYLRLLRRRKTIIAGCVVLAIAIAVASALIQSKVYSATAKLVLQPRSTNSLFDSTASVQVDPARAQDTEIQIITSQPIRDEVRHRIGVAPTVAARPVAGTDIITITAKRGNPRQAAEIANTYMDAYIDLGRQRAVNDLVDAGKQLQSKVTELQAQIDVATGAQKDSLISQQGLFKQKLDQLQVDAALKNGGASVVARATTPKSPSEPRLPGRLVMGSILGLLTGLGLALLVDHLDDTIKTKGDIEQSTSGLPVLGLIPEISAWKRTEAPSVISLDQPNASAAEAYRTLRTAVQFLRLDNPVRVLQVTSAGAEEGKTTTLANLGVALARSGQSVVLVCCDLRRPRLHQFFGFSKEVGFTSVLIGSATLEEALQPVPGVARLQVLVSGPEPPNPSEVLASRRTAEVLQSLRDAGHLVLVDSPPVLPVTDALVLSGKVDGVLLVCAAGLTTKPEAARAVELLGRVNAPTVGTVLNGTGPAGVDGYRYEYYQTSPNGQAEGNGQDSSRKPKARSRRRRRVAVLRAGG